VMWTEASMIRRTSSCSVLLEPGPLIRPEFSPIGVQRTGDPRNRKIEPSPRLRCRRCRRVAFGTRVFQWLELYRQRALQITSVKNDMWLPALPVPLFRWLEVKETSRVPLSAVRCSAGCRLLLMIKNPGGTENVDSVTIPAPQGR
jgi:hypothetical protein